jgi:hypothetical protein
MRYDERFHLDVETDGESVTATMHLSTLEQSWTHRRSEAGPVRLRIVAEPPKPGVIDMTASCDRLLAQVSENGDWVTLAAVDGRYLSSDVCESFTGRVVGPYARSGVVDVSSIEYAGQDIQR